MHEVQVIVKKPGCRRVARVIVIDDSSQKPQARSHVPVQAQTSWTGQVQGGGGMFYGRRKNKK